MYDLLFTAIGISLTYYNNQSPSSYFEYYQVFALTDMMVNSIIIRMIAHYTTISDWHR